MMPGNALARERSQTIPCVHRLDNSAVSRNRIGMTDDAPPQDWYPLRHMETIRYADTLIEFRAEVRWPGLVGMLRRLGE